MEQTEILDIFVRFADKVQYNVDHINRPAYAETCVCGSSVEVGKAVAQSDLRRIHGAFLSRHARCVSSVVLMNGVDE